MMNLIREINEADSIVILGHVRPDGDCIGAATAMYQYIKNIDSNKEVEIILDDFINRYSSISVMNKIKSKSKKASYDLAICVDVANKERIGNYIRYYDSAKKHIAIDHHKTNDNFAEIMYINPMASSTCEFLYSLFDKKYIDKGVAESLFTGLITDTGVFRYSCTNKESFDMASDLYKFGIDMPKIIEEGFYTKSYKLNRFIATCVLNSKTLHNDRTIYTVVTKDMMKEYEISNTEFDGIVEALRNTEGVEVAIFIYEKEHNLYKVSVRSKEYVDVSEICQEFNGGGHSKASGCMLRGEFNHEFEKLLNEVAKRYE